MYRGIFFLRLVEEQEKKNKNKNKQKLIKLDTLVQRELSTGLEDKSCINK